MAAATGYASDHLEPGASIRHRDPGAGETGGYAGLSEDLSLGLEKLRVGDVVALADQDHRYGRGYRPGYLTIGVISTGQCLLFGHGPGPSSLLSGPAEAFALVEDPTANLASWYHGVGR